MSSPYINHFIQPDTIIPNPANPQSFNRYSYVQNNPIRYTDPTGHKECDLQLGCGDEVPPQIPLPPTPPPPNDPGNYCDTHPGACGGGGPPPPLESPDNDLSDPGDYLGGYNGPSGGLQSYHINSPHGDGGSSISVNYIASYDVLIYENAYVIILRENYWIPAYSLPHYDGAAFGNSTLYMQTSNGEVFSANLGTFSPGNLSNPQDLTKRETAIPILGKNNFPTTLVIEIEFGASFVGTRTVRYRLIQP